MQMLFDPFEEDFDLPSFPVELCNGQCREFKIVCHKGVNGIGGIVFVNDQPKFFGIRFRGLYPVSFTTWSLIKPASLSTSAEEMTSYLRLSLALITKNARA